MACFSLFVLIMLRFVATGECSTNQTDQGPGARYIQQLEDAIQEAERQIVNDTSFQDYTPEEGEVFDFIVVGAGSAGSVVANRLSENSSWRILLLEAGGDPTITTEIPGLRSELLGSDLDWQFVTEPEPNSCQENPGSRCSWPSGKVLGGTSTINGMAYVRGHPNDYDFWESLGNPGWGFQNLLPYFKKSEDMRSESVLSEPDALRFHGVGGLWKIESIQSDNITEIVTEGFTQLGFEAFSDPSSQFGEGLFLRQYTFEDTRRCSTAKAFLFDFQTRPNLKISKYSLVVKLLLDENKSAYGVSFIKNGTNFTVNAEKEVILSAGAINSPQLLMLSGIGPEELLRELGIELIQNLRVGYNLQDHLNFEGFPVTLDYESPEEDPVEGIFEFLVRREGYLTGTGVLNVIAFTRTTQATYRNIQFTFRPVPANSSSEGEQSFSRFSVFFRPIVLRPKSRGRISLNSTNPFEPPLIQPNYLSVEEDIQETLEAIEVNNNLVRTQVMVDLKAEVERVNIPACAELEFQTEPYWRCVMKYTSQSVNHYCGTCKMGPEGMNDSVVDPTLRVIGVSNLRVVDASIMPRIPGGNTIAAVVTIAEKAADLIKQSWE